MKIKMLAKMAGVAAVTALGLAGCGGGSSTADGPEVTDSDANGPLVLYSTMTETDLDALTRLLEQEFPGIQIEIVNGNAGELIARIQSESANPQGDMMWGGLDTSNGDTHKDLFEHWLSDYESDVEPEYKSPNGFYNVDHLSTVAFAVNTEIEEELGLDIQGYEDLLDPKLKGRVTIADPTSSSSGWNNIQNIFAVYGEDTEPAWTYIEQLLENGLVIASSSSVPFVGVADGEYAVGMTYEDGIAPLIKSGADNIRLVYPKEGTSATAFGTAVIEGAPHADMAKKVINYIMSPEGQVAYAEEVGTIRVTTTAPYVSEYLPPTDDIHWVPRDVDWMSEHHEEIIEDWTSLYNSLR